MHHRSTPNYLIISILSVALVASLITAGVFYSKSRHVAESTISTILDSPIDKNSFQALFLDNDQVYFGHLKETADGYSLTDVYYPDEKGTGLVKLGAEVHRPQDTMYVPKTSVSFWENLENASQFGGQLR